ncbi:MFS transporter [Gilvibacter sp.]|uniref:MFS transporter n=1 Tax=Gilvibacter sp. TaxID=2729997 RepID=UPI003B52D377
MKQVLPKGSKKLMRAWAFYDWANSVYSLVIASAIFPIYYGALFEIAQVDSVNFLGFEIPQTPFITYVTAAAFLVVSIISPILSGIADYVGNKKNFMKFFCYLGSLSCMALYFFDLDYLYLSATAYFLALIGFWGSLVFYNSYLPDVAYPEQQDRLSAQGFSMGYIGSVLLLVVNLVMVLGAPEGGEMAAMKWSFVMVGVWWILFSQYSFYHLPKGNSASGKIHRKILGNGYKELRGVYRSLSSNPRLKRYLAAFFVYSMAVQTVMLVATYFGEQEIAWGGSSEKTMGLIVSILVIQLVAVIGATLTARASRSFGNIQTLVVINIIWVAICVVAYFITEPFEFYATAGVVGLVMGGIQALSRSTYSKFLPETEDTTSYFSFYDVAEKIGIVIGMGVYGVIDQITGSMRNSVVFLILFFAVGVFLLLRVPRKDQSVENN